MTFTSDCATWREIQAQPDIWEAWATPLKRQAAELRVWIAEKGIEEIWFMGAGTSAFIGQTLAAQPVAGLRLRAVPTTDFVSCPQNFLPISDKVLIVQFGRSGNSSESVGTMELLEVHAPHAPQINITCNAASALATRPAPGLGERRSIILPETTHDSGFAMTSSFTTMLLSALNLLEEHDISALPEMAKSVLDALEENAPKRPERAIFLGCGALSGIARESALKVLELTSGQTLCQWDSALGFRHGPKASIGTSTQVVVFLHPDPHTARYDADVAQEIQDQYPEASVVTIGPDGDIPLPRLDARLAAPLYVLAAQVWAVMWSASLGLNIDDPFSGKGTLSRVVSGVKLYDLPVIEGADR